MPKAIINDVKRLIIPCIIARLIILLGNCMLNDSSLIYEIKIFVKCLLWGNHGGNLFGRYFPEIGRIWFLVALLGARIFYRLLANIFNCLHLTYFIIMISFISMYLSSIGVFLPHNFDMIFICLLFMVIGNNLKNVNLSDISTWKILVLFCFWTYLGFTQNVCVRINSRDYDGLSILVAIAGCICIFLFSQSIENKRLFKPLIFFGRHSLELLVINTIMPYFCRCETLSQEFIFIILQCFLLVIYVYIKEYIMKKIKKTPEMKL